MFCMSCGAAVPEGAAFCPACGARLAGAEKKESAKRELRRVVCTSCGSGSLRKLRKGEYVCEHCGSRFAAEEEEKPVESSCDSDARLMEIFQEAAAYEQKDDYNNELRVLSRGLSVAPDNCTLMLRLGRSYWRLGLQQKAQEYYQRAAELDPDDPIVYVNFASLYLTQRQYEKAKVQYEKGIAIIEADPMSATANDIAVAYGNYALCLGELGDRAGAKKYLRLAKEKGYSKSSIDNICKRLHILPWMP